MEEDKIILEKNGWEIHCESPYEIYHPETDCRASGYDLVDLIIDSIRRENRDEKLIVIKQVFEHNLIDKDTFIKNILETI